jgi:rare lipoprotein A (peptidoglycan hydrolase)
MIKQLSLTLAVTAFLGTAVAQETPKTDNASSTTSPLAETTEAQNTPKTYRITVNGIFPASPTENWGNKSLSSESDKDSLIAEDSDDDEDDVSIADSTESVDNSSLKKDNAPKLRIESSHARRGKAYTVNGKRYVPFASIKNFSQTGVASWYGPGFHGRRTANGERYNQYEMTAAHKELPINSLVKVTRVSTGDSVIVRINDRGPFHKNRVIDLSYMAAKRLGLDKKGSDKVKIELITSKGKNPTL